VDLKHKPKPKGDRIDTRRVHEKWRKKIFVVQIVDSTTRRRGG
jgi:hypothetical protein